MAERDLVSSTDAARTLGVSTATIKRWADAGVLPSIRTAGRHRRFDPHALEDFRRRQGGGRTQSWVGELLAVDDVRRMEALLLQQRATSGSWWKVADALDVAMLELRARWRAGTVMLLDLRLAQERLQRALAHLAEWIPQRADAPRALLALAEGESRMLPLSLVELCLREAGWNTLWLGAGVPMSVVARAGHTQRLDMIVVAASETGRAEPLAAQAALLGRACRLQHLQLVLVGRGAWPQHPPHGRTLRSCAEVHTHLTS
ncbi:MAG: helix-turn-helix domain-containing protein [Myxococcota bacterium]